MSASNKHQNRQRILQILFALGGLILLVKAAQLQIFDNTFRERARAATIDKQVLYPSRGLIYDRTGELLVYNNALYDLQVLYNQVDPEMDTSQFCELLGITKEEFETGLDVDWNSNRYAKSVPFIFLKRIPPDKFSAFLEHQHKFPGFIPVLKNTRGYQHEIAAHVLGYISEVNRQQIEENMDLYMRGDNIGTSGLEKAHEEKLRGNKGLRYVLKDKWGRNVGPFNSGLMDTAAQSGSDLIISIDHQLQAYGEELMRGMKGSIVAIEPSTGEVLSMISSPFYEPSDLAVDRNRNEAFQKILTDTLQPLFNRAVSAKYPPGSVFKPVLALVGMQKDMIGPKEYYRCDGAYYYKNVSWGCHGAPGHYNATTAIQHSCNTYFYDLYKRLVETHGWSQPGQGLNEMNQYLAQFGLGKKLGIDLPNESAGLLPGSEYYSDLYDYQEAEWRSTYIISNGIGQGELQLTTLQMANIAAILANRGYYYTPHFIKDYKNSQKRLPRDYVEQKRVDIDKRYFEPVIEGMEKSVSNGTARLAYIPGIELCGKTGTSENSQGKDHSVFFAFAPRENPQIAIAVYIENGGWGGSYAAPIASLMIEKYLNGEIMEQRKWIENRMLETNLIENP